MICFVSLTSRVIRLVVLTMVLIYVYVCVYTCMYACMYVCMSIYLSIQLSMYVTWQMESSEWEALGYDLEKVVECKCGSPHCKGWVL